MLQKKETSGRGIRTSLKTKKKFCACHNKVSENIERDVFPHDKTQPGRKKLVIAAEDYNDEQKAFEEIFDTRTKPMDEIKVGAIMKKYLEQFPDGDAEQKVQHEGWYACRSMWIAKGLALRRAQ